MSLNVYVGPYLEIGNVKDVEIIPKTFAGCSNRDCSNFEVRQPGKFCQECGQKLKTIKTSQTRRVNWAQIFYDLNIEDEVFDVTNFIDNLNDGKNIFISNFKDEHVDIHSGVYPINDLEDDSFTLKFLERIEPIVKHADKHGIKFKVGYGLVAYYW